MTNTHNKLPSNNIPIYSHIPHEWYEAIVTSQVSTGITLESQIEHYTVITLNKYTQGTNLLDKVFSVGFLELLTASRGDNPHEWTDIADKVLVLLGLFPEYAQKRKIEQLYYTMAESCYLNAYNVSRNGLHQELYEAVYDIVEVIRNVRA